MAQVQSELQLAQLTVIQLGDKLTQARISEGKHTARALIEYVENFVMDIDRKKSRRLRWTEFFTSDPRGKIAYSCIIAERLSSASQFQSDVQRPWYSEWRSFRGFERVYGLATLQHGGVLEQFFKPSRPISIVVPILHLPVRIRKSITIFMILIFE